MEFSPSATPCSLPAKKFFSLAGEDWRNDCGSELPGGTGTEAGSAGALLYSAISSSRPQHSFTVSARHKG